MTVLLWIAIALVAYGLGVAVVFRLVPALAWCWVEGRHYLPDVFRAVLRRVIGARPKLPRHRTTSAKGSMRHA